MKWNKEVREKGATDNAIDPEIPLNQGPKLYQFELCHMRFVGCTRQLIEVRLGRI